jgi:hypothetical protein
VHATQAAALATRSYEEDRSLGLAEIVAQVRSTAIDLVRAAQAAARMGEPAAEPSTEELVLGMVAPRRDDDTDAWPERAVSSPAARSGGGT